ncbi:MAG: DNA repair protein RecO [Bacteroidales bacterium]|nr:DNA repair protein RecO [Bacteroidales bacterium]NLK80780.1 DNA repair protein RecO [Bacteroidales bacterium]
MIVSTEGIVLHSIKYSDSSIIAHIYTEKFGIGSYIMNNVRGKLSKTAYFQSLSHVNIVAYKKHNTTISRLSKIEFATIHVNIYSDIYKASVAQFLGEFLHKIIHSEEANPALFKCLSSAVSLLNNSSNVRDIHIRILIQLMPYFGVLPENTWNTQDLFFDIQTGRFCACKTDYCLCVKTSEVFHNILADASTEIKLNKPERALFLASLIDYYRIHVASFKTIKSIEVLQMVFA